MTRNARVTRLIDELRDVIMDQFPQPTRARSCAFTKLDEAQAWLAWYEHEMDTATVNGAPR